MEFTREIYWNVGTGVLVPMYGFFVAALLIFVYGFARRIKVYRQGRPLDRKDHFVSRVVRCLKDVILQTKVLRSKGPGTAHALFFWSFLLLLLGTTLIFIQVDITDPLFEIKFLQGAFYLIFSLVLDLAGLVAILAMAGLFVRRYFVRPKGLITTWQDALMHGLLFATLLTGFLIEGLRMAVTELNTNMTLAWFSPVGLLFAVAFSSLEESTVRQFHYVTWWVHFFLTMGFIASIPFTKFRHLITTSANYFFADRRPTGSLETIDLEDETTESYGVATVKDLTWKSIFDADACMSCKRCQDVCPAYATGKPLSPMKLINQIGLAAFNEPETNLIDFISKDVLWACTTCRACEEVCPASIEHLTPILEMRRSMALMEGEFPGEEVKTTMKNIEVNFNPFGMAFASRGDWAEGLPVKTIQQGQEIQEVDVLYFVGCYASFDQRNMRVAKSFVEICEAAGIRVAILGKAEKCCGEPVRKLGNEYLYQTLAVENIELINACGVKKIVTTCPHCFNTLGRDYRDLGFDLEVEHYTTFLARLVSDGKLKLKSESFDCTYHDSCYIGRYMDIIDPPRQLLEAAGATIHEMKCNRKDSFCCGAGGGLIFAEEKVGTRVNVTRVKMAQETNTKMLVSNCPFCLTMFEDGVKTAELDEELEAKDLAEILLERIER